VPEMSGKTLLIILAAMILAFPYPEAGLGASAPKPSLPVQLDVVPLISAADQPVKIRVTGLGANQSFTLFARMRDEAGRSWSSYATFRADRKGVVDPALQAPLTGTYWDVDPMGLFWSMKPWAGGATEYEKKTLDPVVVEFYLEDENGRTLASRTIERRCLTPEVEAEPVDSDGLTGMFFRPKSGGLRPGVMVLGDPGAGPWLDVAAVLASHGYAAFALAVPGADGRSAAPIHIPLEYFEKGLQWLTKQAAVKKGGVAVLGRSRGGELALLLGSRFRDIKAVAAYSPSSVLTQGAPRGKTGVEAPTVWTWQGRVLPFLHYRISPEETARIGQSLEKRRGIATERFYGNALKDRHAVSQATIAVEKIGGPVLLISGESDALWPAARFCSMAAERLKSRRFPYPYRHLSYKRAGHSIALPYQPSTVAVSLDKASGLLILQGGREDADAAARVQAWREVLRFLKEKFEPALPQ